MNPLSMAAELLARPGGWTQEDSRDKRDNSDGLGVWAYCIIGALCAVMRTDVTSQRKRACQLIFQVLVEQKYVDPPDEGEEVDVLDEVITFNDEKGRKVEQVIGVLEKAAPHWDEP